MIHEKRNTRKSMPTVWLFSLCALPLLLTARPGHCQPNVFFRDTISTDTVIIALADSFVTAMDTGVNKRVGWAMGQLAMSHRAHEKAGVSCVTCHHKNGNDARIKQCTQCHKGIAGMETMHNKCGQCHINRNRDVTCSQCHLVERNTVRAQLKEFKFSHIKHYSRKADCRFCHTEPQRDAWVKHDNYPAMKTCFTCHDNRKSSGQCSVCHSDVAQITPASHTYKWAGRNGHGLDARYNKAECTQCHSKRECDRCHLGQTSCRIHTPGYRYMHGIDVRMGVTNCAMCHETKHSCSQCHENRSR